MAYSNESEKLQQKTVRIGILCSLIAFMGFLFAVSRPGCATACEPTPEVCRDTFHIVNDGTNNYECPPGSRVEIISSPPAPKPGVLCHCINTLEPAASGSPMPSN